MVFLPVVVVLQPYGHFAGAAALVVILVALLVCLIPTTIGALLSAIGIAGMDRLVRRNVLAMSGRAVEAGDVLTLRALNVMGLHSPQSAVLSAAIVVAGLNAATTKERRQAREHTGAVPRPPPSAGPAAPAREARRVPTRGRSGWRCDLANSSNGSRSCWAAALPESASGGCDVGADAAGRGGDEIRGGRDALLFPPTSRASRTARSRR